MSVSVKKENEQRRSTAGLFLLVVGIILLASNLRAPITSVGPVIASIRESLGISNTAAGALTTVPLLAFAILSPFAPRLARRFGMEVVLFFVLLLLTIGLIIRPLGQAPMLFTGAILVGVGIAIANVLMPAFIKMKFANNLGVMTGVYSLSMNITGALAAGLSIPIAASSNFGWKGSLGIWAALSFVALILWIPQLLKRQAKANEGQDNSVKSKSLWHSKLAWQVTIFMGLQSLLFYTLVAWLPVILQGRGMSPSTAGWMLSAIQFAQLPFTFIVPVIAGRMKNQIPLVWVTFSTIVAGLCGVLFGGTMLILPSAILIGIGSACAFGIVMMFFSLRTRNTYDAANLSGMAQCFGYLLAASGPPLFGLLFDVTNSWTIPLVFLIAATVLLLVVGLGAGKDRFVGEA